MFYIIKVSNGIVIVSFFKKEGRRIRYNNNNNHIIVLTCIKFLNEISVIAQTNNMYFVI